MSGEVAITGVIECDISDHYSTFIKLNFAVKRKQALRLWVRKISSQHIDSFVGDLDSEVAAVNPLDFSDLLTCLTKVTNNFFPKSRLSRRQFIYAKKL